MFYLYETFEYQDMTESWKTWKNGFNLRMVKDKNWKQLWNTGMLISIMSGNWTLDLSHDGLDQINAFIMSDQDWKHRYYEWEKWWEYESKFEMQSITNFQRLELLKEFDLIKIEANDLSILK